MFRGDDACRDSDDDHPEGLEGRLQATIVRESAVEKVGGRQCECKTAREAFGASDEDFMLVGVQLFFRSELFQWKSNQ